MKMKRQVRRFDYGELRQSSRTPQGFLLIPGFATRCGVFPYMDGSGKIRRELRHPDDVFAPESLATLKYAPVTIEHPPVMLNPTNVSEYRKGHTTERVEVNREMVDTDLIIEDQDAIDAVEKEGMRELSSGYLADVVDEEGVYNGAPYDMRQKNIRYNHLAIVKRGRAGPEVRLRLDSADAVMQSEVDKPAENTFSQESGVNDAEMGAVAESKKVVILGREVDLPSDVADTFQDYLDRYDEMRAKLAKLEEEMSTKARKDQKDADISQPGVSPQVKVEQQTPDGRKAPGKTAAAPGSITGGPSAKADDEEEKEKEDGEADEKEDAEKEESKGKEDAEKDEKADDEKDDGEESLEKLKKDLESLKGKYDAAVAKKDAEAAASMNQPEKKADKMDSKEMIRSRVKLERQAEKLVPYEVSKKFDSMSDKEILAAVIKYRHPKADLEGKNRSYLQSRFDSIVETLAEEGSAERQKAGKALLGLGGGRMDSSERADSDPSQARLKMVSESRELYKQNLSASKK